MISANVASSVRCLRFGAQARRQSSAAMLELVRFRARPARACRAVPPGCLPAPCSGRRRRPVRRGIRGRRCAPARCPGAGERAAAQRAVDVDRAVGDRLRRRRRPWRSTVRSRFSRVHLLAGAHRRGLHQAGLGRSGGVLAGAGAGFGRGARVRRAARRGRRAAAAPSPRSYCARNFASSGRPTSRDSASIVAGAVGQRDRQHAGVAQRHRPVRARRRASGTSLRPPKSSDHRGALEQLRRALHAVAHLRGELRDIERAHAQVGDADLADLQFAGLLVIGMRRHAQVPVASVRGDCAPAARAAAARAGRAGASP